MSQVGLQVANAKIDFTAVGGLGFWMMTPITDDARLWVLNNINDGEVSCQGGSYVVEGRYIEDIGRGIVSDGLTLEVNGLPAYLSPNKEVMSAVVI